MVDRMKKFIIYTISFFICHYAFSSPPIYGPLMAQNNLDDVDNASIALANLGGLASSIGTPAPLANEWVYGPDVLTGGQYLSIFDSLSSFPAKPDIQIQRKLSTTVDLSPDFVGAPGASIPLVYVQGQVSGGKNIQGQAISGYMDNINSQDAIGVSGRVRREPGATSDSGQADATGVYGSGYQFDSLAGPAIGGEFAIFQNVSGNAAADTVNFSNAWSVAIHATSVSNSSPASAALYADASTNYGFWNGIILDPSIWIGTGGTASAPSTGAVGTVGINGGSWSGTSYPYTGIKMGNAVQDIWCSFGACNVNSLNGVFSIYGNGNPISTPTTSAGVDLIAASSNNAYVNFTSGGTTGGNIFYGVGNIFTINSLGTNTTINPSGGTVSIPTPATGNSSTQAASTAFVANTFASPPSTGYGNTTPEPIAATTISANSTVSGTGFSTYLASPPAIGGTTPAAGKFTTLQATSTITPSTTAGIVGTTAADNAQAGSVGEYISNSASSVSLTSTVAINITSVSLTAGDWQCIGNIDYRPAGSTTATNYQGWMSTTSASAPSLPSSSGFLLSGVTFSAGSFIQQSVGSQRFNVSSTTTIYLSSDQVFSVSTNVADGFIGCRRER